MKLLSVLVLCFCSSSLFAQNGFFLQPQLGGGVSNVHWAKVDPSPLDGPQHNIFSFQGTLEAGYRSRRWEFITGLGYFRTGYAGPDVRWTYSLPVNPWPSQTDYYPMLGTSITYNPHIILPVKVGYQLHLSKKLKFTPYLGAEIAYNLPRVYIEFNHRSDESHERFNYFCNKYTVFGLSQLNLEYKVSKHIDFTGGFSAHYELTALVRSHQEFDYAALVNLGMRYNFKHKGSQHP